MVNAENLHEVSDRDKMADTTQNAAAGQFLVQVRRALELKQLDLAGALAEKLGVPVSQSTLSGWENGTRSVPGAAIVASLELLGRRLEAGESAPLALRDEVGKLGGDVRRLGDGLVRALEALAEPTVGQRTSAQRADRILDIALEIRRLLDAEEEPQVPVEGK
jgi:transcriptional regulator with XRE-family HTH domain